jgi:hypothetical protein
VIRNPRDPYGTVLVIMGRDDAELRVAAASISSGRGVFGGAKMSFDGAACPAIRAMARRAGSPPITRSSWARSWSLMPSRAWACRPAR